MKCSSIKNKKINQSHFLSNFRILLAFLLEEVNVVNDSKSYLRQHVIRASQRKQFSSDTILLDVPTVLLLLMMMMIAMLNAYKSPTCLFRWPAVLVVVFFFFKKKKKLEAIIHEQ